MNTHVRTLRTIRSGLLQAMIAFGLVLGSVQTGFAQTAPGPASTPLGYFKNYIVTGDYVGGGVGLRGLGDANGFATGTIKIPDKNSVPAAGVPPGADIVAAFLYWQTVEKSQSASAGRQGFFNGYPIAGKSLGNQNAPVSWSAGGCAGSSNGTTTLRTYRADVRPYLNVVNGKAQGNGSYQVRLADSGSNGGGTPLTLGATLVLVYRVLSPTVPLNAVVFYDGAFAPGNGSQTMSQMVQGFYQAATSSTPVAKLTHIVGNGQTNKSEQVSLNNVTLPSLYQGLPPFPGFYNGSWDNPTWVVNQYGNVVIGNDSSAITVVQPASTNSGCVSWSAVVFSTTVQNRDDDGLLDTWKTNQGYTDFESQQFVPLPGAALGQEDLFVQIGFMCSSLTDGVCDTTGHSHLPFNSVLQALGDTYHSHGVALHIDIGGHYPNNPYVITTGTPAGGNAISEAAIACDPGKVAPPKVCAYPGQPVLGWKGGFNGLLNQNFPAARRNSYHYVLFAHQLALPTTSWSILEGTLQGISVSGNAATVTTSSPHGLSSGAVVTVSGALADFDLDGSYSITVPHVPSPTTFTFTTANVTAATYSNPGLAVASGPARTTSGWADYGGGHAAVFLGTWHSDNDAGCQTNPEGPLGANQTYCTDQVGSAQSQLGTLIHELGHTFGLSHGGAYTDAEGNITYGLNCRANYQSSMSYLFQLRGLLGFDGSVINDYSSGTLPQLLESSLNESAGLGSSLPYQTRWFAPFGNNFLDKTLSKVGNRAATRHCDGLPKLATDPPTERVDGPSAPGPIDWNNDEAIEDSIPAQDINFNGTTADPMFLGFNDWAVVDLRQIGSARNAYGFSSGVGTGDLGSGGGDQLGGTGGDQLGGTGGDQLGGTGGDQLGGTGGDQLGGTGGDQLGGTGGEELHDFDFANSTVDPPTSLNCSDCTTSSPGVFVEPNKAVSLTWTPPGFGQIRVYYVWRADITKLPMSSTNPPTLIKTLGSAANITPPPTTYVDSNVKTSATYLYFVTSGLGNDSGTNSGNESGPSNMITVSFK
jgi:hypothetical protein